MSSDSPSAPNDLSAFWMPFTANRQFKSAPRMLVAAEGMHYTSADGRQILDGTAGLWCCNAGHCRPKITKAIQEGDGGAADKAIAKFQKAVTDNEDALREYFRKVLQKG